MDMTKTTFKCLLYPIDLSGPEEIGPLFEEINQDITDAGVTVLSHDYQLGRATLLIPEGDCLRDAEDVLKSYGVKLDDAIAWTCGPFNGKNIEAEIVYRDNSQLVSATIDEGILLTSYRDLKARTDTAALRIDELIITAFASDNDFSWGYQLIDGSLVFQDYRDGEKLYTPENDGRWVKDVWDPEEPMLEISFTPQAELTDRTIVPVVMKKGETEWVMPVRLLPKGFDASNPEHLDKLAQMPCAPQEVRDWIKVCPYEVAIDNPEILSEPETLSP